MDGWMVVGARQMSLVSPKVVLAFKKSKKSKKSKKVKKVKKVFWSSARNQKSVWNSSKHGRFVFPPKRQCNS